MKRKRMGLFLCLVLVASTLFGCGEAFPHHFADRKEAVECFLSNTDYFDGFSECELQYKMQDKEATMEKYLKFGEEQMGEFTDNQKTLIEELLKELEEDIKKEGYTLPELEEMVFINSTQVEEGGSAAYTHGTQIYFDGSYLEECLSSEEEETRLEGKCLMWHEIFHCLTRSNPKFREDMYRIIDFTVVPEDFEIPPSVQEKFISNPDVGHHNSYATFAIQGEKKDCFCAIIAKQPFEKEGDTFFSCVATALVPTDGSDVYYLPEDADNFWQIFGKNTGYVLDPEECMADNFMYAMTYGLPGKEYENPEIIEAILEYVKETL
ncbi:MAG: hypothetical protein IJ679_10590 [Lachnospiraceae bacterium]|nr:hypothetical protein [Lachnospiraceae bacterium]